MSTLFEEIGGKAAVDAAVDRFYEHVLADERIRHFFRDTDMDRQRQHQKLFLTYAFGGMPNYPGKSMREAHRHLVENAGLNDSHFDAVVELLALTLRELGVGEELIGRVAAVAESVRDEVLNR